MIKILTGFKKCTTFSVPKQYVVRCLSLKKKSMFTSGFLFIYLTKHLRLLYVLSVPAKVSWHTDLKATNVTTHSTLSFGMWHLLVSTEKASWFITQLWNKACAWSLNASEQRSNNGVKWSTVSARSVANLRKTSLGRSSYGHPSTPMRGHWSLLSLA